MPTSAPAKTATIFGKRFHSNVYLQDPRLRNAAAGHTRVQRLHVRRQLGFSMASVSIRSWAEYKVADGRRPRPR